MQNEAIISPFKTDPNLSDEESLSQQINNFNNIYNNIVGPILSPSAGSADTQTNEYVALLESRLLNTEEGSEEEAEVLKEIEEFIRANN